MDSTEKPKKRRFVYALLFILALIVIAAGYAGYTRYVAQHAGAPVYDNGVFDVRLQNLETGMLLHEKRIAALEDELKKQSGKPMASVNNASPSTMPADDARVSALEKQVAALKSAPTGADNPSVAHAIRLLSAFYRLNDKVVAGKPFATELSEFEDIADESLAKSESVTALAPYADSGVPTFAGLLESFDDAVQGFTTVESTPPADANLWQRFLFNLQHLISVRKLDETQAGNTADAIIDRAEAHLDREEVEAAVSEIKSLPEFARGSFTNWVEDAQMTVAAPALMNGLEEQVMQKAFGGAPQEKGR